jgi:ribosomal protein L14
MVDFNATQINRPVQAVASLSRKSVQELGIGLIIRQAKNPRRVPGVFTRRGDMAAIIYRTFWQLTASRALAPVRIS